MANKCEIDKKEVQRLKRVISVNMKLVDSKNYNKGYQQALKDVKEKLKSSKCNIKI